MNMAPLLSIRPADERGETRLPWLESRHSFSFGAYHNPDHVNFRSLRVINDDVVAPGKGFGEHGHRDMEIITWIIDGELEHRDSLSHGGVLRHGDVQVMSAGSGIRHSEMNPSNRPVHLLQIWILPDARNLTPRYDQHRLEPAAFTNRLFALASKQGQRGAVPIHQDATVYVAELEQGRAVDHDLKPTRFAWVQLARGRVIVNGTPLRAGDGASFGAGGVIHIEANESAELLLFDLA